MASVSGNALKIDWTDPGQVYDLASKLAQGGEAQIIFWNGKNYQITHASKSARVLADGHSIYLTVGV